MADVTTYKRALVSYVSTLGGGPALSARCGLHRIPL
jgi:hypothetical protein